MTSIKSRVYIFIYLSIWLASMTVPETSTLAEEHNGDSCIQTLKKPAIIAFLAAAFLMQFSHGVYYAFYSIYMEETGYSKSVIGQFWALGVIAEVMVFVFMHHFLQRFGAGLVLMISLTLASLRWLMIGWFPDVMVVLLIAQTLHAATFGTFHAAAIHMVHRAFPGRHQGKGQALYASISFGLGGALGSLLAGNLTITSLKACKLSDNTFDSAVCAVGILSTPLFSRASITYWMVKVSLSRPG